MMAIDLERAGKMKKVRYSRLESWEVEGHEVAWLKFEGTRPDGSTFSGKELYCECDFVDRNAPHTICEHKKVIREHFREEARKLYYGEWVRMGPEEAVLDIFRRARAKERLFEHHHGVIYVQEIAELLALPVRAVWALCDKLFAGEKLDLNGAILIPYVRRFRFPKELQNLMAYIIEEPLGWPNGEAGDCFLEEIEGAINGYTHFKHGKDAFHEENYPYIAPHHLLTFGLNWVTTAIARAESGVEAREDLRLFKHGIIARELENLAKRLRRLARKMYMVVTIAEPNEIFFIGSKNQCETFRRSLPPKRRKLVVVKPESYLR